MTSRTPIRLTPHRGPLATPPVSPESSPTSSTPPSEISYCSTDMIPTLDIAILQHRISTLSPPMQYQIQPRPYRRRHEVTKQELFGHTTHLCPFILAKRLLRSAYDLTKTLVWIVTFCLLIWGLLEWTSRASELRPEPSPWMSIPRLPLPPRKRDMRCHMNPSLYEPKEQHVTVLQFFSEQIQHAKALSSLSVGLGFPLRAFFESHRASILRVTVPHNISMRPPLDQEVDIMANLTAFLDPSHSLLDFTSSSFIGRSLALALDELGDLMSEPIVSHGSSAHEKSQDAHLYAIYWRTTSNLLLEYSAARPRTRGLLQDLQVLHRQLSPLVSSNRTAGRVGKSPNRRWWKDIVRQPATSVEDGMQAFMSELETMLDNVHRLIAYLDWVTEQLSQTTLEDVLKMSHKTDFSSCMISLQELFARTKPSMPKRLCFCLDDFGAISPAKPERVEIIVPGSPTVRAGR